MNRFQFDSGDYIGSSISGLSYAFAGQYAKWVEPGLLGIFTIVVIMIMLFKPKKLAKPKKDVRPERSEYNELGSADMATSQQIAKWTRTTGPLDTNLPVEDLKGNKPTLKKGNLVVPIGERNRHMLIIAKTGSGKTTKLILPVLYNDCMCPTRSTIVIDSKPEMWQKLAAMTAHYNPKKKIILFNPLDRIRSLSWNILSKVEDDTDCKLIAQTIIAATDVPGSKNDSPFFRNIALQILNALMVGLLKDPNEKLSMPRIHELVHSGIKGLCNWIEAHPDAIRNCRTFVELARAGSQNADTVMSELGMRLSAWDLTAIRATTFMDEIDLETLVAEPSLFIIELRESEIEMLRPMANVIVVELLRFLTKRAESCPKLQLPRPVSLVIDEFASAVGRLPDIHIKLNTLRSRNVSIVAAIQSIGQIKAVYEDKADSVIAGFSTKILMPALEYTDAEWASKESGQMTIRFKTSSSGKNKRLIDFWSNTNTGIQEHVQQRAVLTPSEIGNPVDSACTFFLPNTPVFQGQLVPYYKLSVMSKRFSQFDNPKLELVVRKEPLPEEKPYELRAHETVQTDANGTQSAGAANGATKQPTPDEIKAAYDALKPKIEFEKTVGIAKEWWEAFEKENEQKPLLILSVAQELSKRNATISEFFLAYVYSNTDNIQANLNYLDYRRLAVKEDEQKKQAEMVSQIANTQSGPNGAGTTPPAATQPVTVQADAPNSTTSAQ